MAEKKYIAAFKVQRYLMILTGSWPKEEYGILYKCYGFVMSLLIQTLFMMPSLLQVFSASTDVAETSYILFCTITIFTYSIKVIVLFVKKNLFYKILDDLEQPLFTVYQNFHEVYINNAVLISVTIRKMIHAPCIIFIIFIATYPVLDNKNSKRPLPFDMPIDINSLPFFVYVLIYCLEILAAAVCACNNANIDTFMCSLMCLGTGQLQILEKNLSILVESISSAQFLKETPENYGQFDDIIDKNVKNCVRHHMAILDYIDKLEGMFSYVFLAQFLTSIIAICIAGFSFIVNISKITKTVISGKLFGYLLNKMGDMLKNTPVSNILFGVSASYFAAAMAEISMYCIFGDELITESVKIKDACYMSKWNMCGLKVRKSMFIIMERSKRPVALTAAKFTTLSRESLVAICKSSFSYFAVLRKLYGEN